MQARCVRPACVGNVLMCDIINYKKLISLQHRVKATKSHIQNSTNHFTGLTPSDHVSVSLIFLRFRVDHIRYDTIEEINVDSKAEYTA